MTPDPTPRTPMKLHPSRFAFHLRRVREVCGWTQEELAQRCGLQPAAISHFETGHRTPSLGNFIKVAEALKDGGDLELEWLLAI